MTPTEPVAQLATGRHRRKQWIPYARCPGCQAVIAFDADELRAALPTAFIFGDLFGSLPKAEWFPREWLEVAERVIEDHEQTCPARTRSSR